MFTVAVSSRALFNIEDGHEIFKKEGFSAFGAYMRKNEKKPLRPGAAFALVKKLLALNVPDQPERIRVVLLSSNTLDAGARVMYSVQHYGLGIDQAFFTSGRDRFRIAKAGNVSLFLSTNPQEVGKALSLGIPSATVKPSSKVREDHEETQGLCIAFDGDAVIFSDVAERINQTEGLAAFQASERTNARIPLPPGPFKPVLASLLEIQADYAHLPTHERPLRIALVTARGSLAFERVLRTFRAWGLQVDEALFCAGQPKGPFLEALDADLFFDDGMHHVDFAAQFVPACHVPNGIVGERDGGLAPEAQAPLAA